MINSARQVLLRALRDTGAARVAHGNVEVDLPDTSAQERVLTRLEQADPADPARNLVAELEHPTLFDLDD